MSYILNISFIALITFYLFIAPYTKVEESFNIQAIYDMLNYGYEDLSEYDHNEFPGAVKRTFVGALALTTITKYLESTCHRVLSHFDDIFTKTQLDKQILLRLILGLVNGLSLINLKSSITRACSLRSSSIGSWYGFLQFTQFHIVYYASRPLPNFLALPFVNFALSKVILGDVDLALMILIFTSTVFRVELVAFTGLLFVVCLASRQTSMISGIKSLLLGGIVGLMLTGFVDSYFWQTESYIFPEIESFVYNVIEGKSADWGVEPINAYFAKYFLQLFTAGMIPLLSIPALFFDLVNYKVNTIRSVVITSFLYVCVMSLQPHKELRFIIYAVPGITMAAATTIAWCVSKKDALSKIINLCAILATLLCFSVSLFKGFISSLNYPGGVALQSLNNHLIGLDTPKFSMENNGEVLIHLDVPACMTGVSLFGQLDNNELNHITVRYDKTEDQSKLEYNDYEMWHSFNYVITDYDTDNYENTHQLMFEKLATIPMCEWVKIDVTEGFSGISRAKLLQLKQEIVKDPLHFAYLVMEDIKTFKFKFLRNTLEDIVTTEPQIFTYQNICY